MRGLKVLLSATALLATLVLAPLGNAQISIGEPPVCSYGYYDYAPYSFLRSGGFYGPGYFYNGIFLGMGPWANWAMDTDGEGIASPVVEEEDITAEVVLWSIADVQAVCQEHTAITVVDHHRGVLQADLTVAAPMVAAGTVVVGIAKGWPSNATRSCYQESLASDLVRLENQGRKASDEVPKQGHDIIATLGASCGIVACKPFPLQKREWKYEFHWTQSEFTRPSPCTLVTFSG